MGSSVLPSGQPSAALARRLEASLAAAEANPGAYVIVTGGAVANGHAEGPAMARWLAERGFPQERIHIEPRARSTRQNAEFVLPFVRALGLAHLTVVTERYHLRRGTFHMRAALRENGLLEVQVQALAAPDALGALGRLGLSLLEWGKLARDRLRAVGRPRPQRRP